jgi:ribosomal protein S6
LVPERREQARPLDRGKEASGTVNAYEIMLMLDPELPEERQNEILARARELVERRGGSWTGHEGEATYHVFHFDADAETLGELTRVLKITDGALRHMAVRRPAARRVEREKAVTPTG